MTTDDPRRSKLITIRCDGSTDSVDHSCSRCGDRERLNTYAAFEPEPIYKRHGLGEVGRELKRRIAAGEDANLLARLLLKWVIEAGEAPIEWNRHLVEIPDTFAVARWSRDADVAQIARCILATLKYEPHAADTSTLREVLTAIAGKGSCS